MLLRNRAASINSAPVAGAKGFEHIPAPAIAVIRWLNVSGVDYVLVGAVARAVRGDMGAQGPAAIVAAPYGRNLDRLVRALTSVQMRESTAAETLGIGGAVVQSDPVKLVAQDLLRATGWSLRCGVHAIDVEGRPAGSPSYQDLLYEAVRTELAQDVWAEVAAPEDIEHYTYVRRTGSVPEMVVSRTR